MAAGKSQKTAEIPDVRVINAKKQKLPVLLARLNAVVMVLI